MVGLRGSRSTSHWRPRPRTGSRPPQAGNFLKVFVCENMDRGVIPSSNCLTTHLVSLHKFCGITLTSPTTITRELQLPRAPSTEVLCNDRLNWRRNNPTLSLDVLLPEARFLSKIFHSFPSAWHSYVNPETGSLAHGIVLRGWFSWNVISTLNVYNSFFDNPGSLCTCGFLCSETITEVQTF